MKTKLVVTLSFILLFVLLVGCNINDNRNNVTIKPYTENGKTYINFGRYPQTVVSDENLIKELDKITNTNEFGYIEYNEKEYKALSAKPYNRNILFENGNAIIYGQKYYFEVEPIKWRVLEDIVDGYKLLSENLLDTPVFYSSHEDRIINDTTIYANNYEYSNIRAWLNGYNGTSYNVADYSDKGFINIAFTKEEQEVIKTTLVDNSLITVDNEISIYQCSNTQDKVFLLSVKDITNSIYGFNSDETLQDIEKVAKPSDYTLAKGCLPYTDTSSEFYQNAAWFLRTPDINSNKNARNIDPQGIVNGGHNVINTNNGIRVALEIEK